MAATRVIVHGAAGRMGREVITALAHDPDSEPVGAVDVLCGDSVIHLPDGLGDIPYEANLEKLLERCRADVVVDFSVANACLGMASVAASHGLHLVIGTTGLTEVDLATMSDLSTRNGVGILVAPNFALGAVVLSHLASLASRFFEYADIFEAHHEAKIDAPSGTALKLAKDITAIKRFTHVKPEAERLLGTRGGEHNGVSIHSTRMPGRIARHEVVFGALGQTLTLSHDTISRESYMPGILLAAKAVSGIRELCIGLESILGLSREYE